MAADRQARDPLFSCLFDRRAGAERFECPVEHSPRIQAHLNGLRCEDSGRLEEGSFAVKITGGHPIGDEGPVPSTRDDEATLLQLTKRSRHRPASKSEVGGQLADRRKSLASTKQSGG